MLLEARGVFKSFEENRVLKNVNLRVKEGSIHALVGENGAGKSTLMKILYGALQADAGEVLLKGESVSFRSPLEAVRAGIGMVFQHFMLIESFSVLENLLLGHEPQRGPLVDWERGKAELGSLLTLLDARLPQGAEVERLSVIEKQRLEILKVLYRKARILIFDEPTAVLGPKEVRLFLELLKSLRSEGRTIILISHKLREVLEVADEITVLRKGESVETREASETKIEDLVRLMIGRDLKHFERRMPREERPSSPVIRLKVRDRLGDMNLVLSSGEIVGVAGLENQGQRSLCNAVSGFEGKPNLKVEYFHESEKSFEDLTHVGVRERRRRGIQHLSEDRIHEGLFLDLSLWENFYLGRRAKEKQWFLSQSKISSQLNPWIERFEVRTQGPRDHVKNLSGGNQQKFWLAQEVSLAPKVLIVEQPTRGIDLGAIEKIHTELMQLRDQGVSILLVSAELDELLSLSDRILVMNGGRIAAEISDLDRPWRELKEQIGEAMLCPG